MEMRVRSIDEIEDLFRDPHNAIYTSTKLIELMETDDLRMVDVVSGIRDLVETWPASSCAAFLGVVCSNDIRQRAKDFALISYSWGAGYVGRVLHHLICADDTLAAAATVISTSAALLSQLFAERSIEYVGDVVHAFVAPCLSESTNAFWNDGNIASLLLHVSTHACVLPSSTWPLDPYIFGVVNYLGKQWGRRRRNTLIHILLDELCHWVRVDHKRQLADLLCLFTDQWPVAHSAELVHSYTLGWTAYHINELLCELGRTWPISTRVGFFVHVINLVCPPRDVRSKLWPAARHPVLFTSLGRPVAIPIRQSLGQSTSSTTAIAGSDDDTVSESEDDTDRGYSSTGTDRPGSVAQDTAAIASRSLSARVRPQPVLNRVLLLYDVSRMWNSDDQQRLRDSIL